MTENKSVLDGMEIKEQGFPLGGTKAPHPAETLDIVSKCPQCGCPIYGKLHVRSSDEPDVRRTCSCTGIKQFADTIQTK